MDMESADDSFELLPHRLAEVAAARPERVALIQGDVEVTYGALWARVVAAGEQLNKLIAPSDRVGIVMDNGADYVVAVYAIWYAGGIAVGLNTALKDPDLLDLLHRCEARVALLGATAGRLSQPLEGAGVVVPTTSAWQSARGVTGTPSPVAIRPGDSAAIIFTSGTTGEPKGVLLSHGSLAANVAGVQAILPMRPDDVTLCALPFHYAFGGSVLHTHMTLGATLMLEKSLMYPQHTLRRMAASRVTAFYGVPSSYYLLMDQVRLHGASLSALRYCAQAGGAMDPSRIERFCALLPSVGFWVMYGQSEACSRLTTLNAADRRRKAGSVGLPLPGVSLRIAGRDDRTLPPGEIGEVCARGPNIMQGYWQAPEETAAALRGGWLRTGDLGYLDAEGYLYLQGRVREIIKVGAHRVAPQEIERVIQGVPGVVECAVVAQEDDMLGEAVRACVVAPGADERLRREILRACRECLALYKVPKQVIFMTSLPRTASGKIRKHLLRATRTANSDWSEE